MPEEEEVEEEELGLGWAEPGWLYHRLGPSLTHTASDVTLEA